MSHLTLDLYQNAIDSIKHAIEHYTSDPVEERRYKYAILHLSQGVSLMLKERLSREHPNFIYKDVSKPDGATVDVATAIGRLKSIAGVNLGDDTSTVFDLAQHRNRIEHYAFDLSKQQADSIIGRTVPFLVQFTSSELGQEIQHAIGSTTWQALIRIQEYRNNAIRTAKKIIRDQQATPLQCQKCQDETAKKAYIQKDEWGLRSYVVSCLACLDVVSSGMVCLGCHKEIPLDHGVPNPFYSYCSDCTDKAASEYGATEFPTYACEVERWFKKNQFITYDQLRRFVHNVSTLVSGAPRLPDQLFRIGAIDFADEYYRERHETLKEMSREELRKLGLAFWSAERLVGDERFIWVWKRQEDVQ